MVSPINALRPIPAEVQSLRFQVQQDLQEKLDRDPDFKIFFDLYRPKIQKLFDNIVLAVKDLKGADSKEIASKLLNGPLELSLIKTGPERKDVTLSLYQEDQSLQIRDSISEGELEASIRDWKYRAVCCCQQYILKTQLSKLKAMLDSEGGIEASFFALPLGRSSKIRFLSS